MRVEEKMEFEVGDKVRSYAGTDFTVISVHNSCCRCINDNGVIYIFGKEVLRLLEKVEKGNLGDWL